MEVNLKRQGVLLVKGKSSDGLFAATKIKD